MVEQTGFLLGSFLTVLGSIFIAELTDKDALLVLALATKIRPLTVFAAGSIAFTITTTIIVSVGSVLVQFVPIFWIKVAGGAIMVGYAGWVYTRTRAEGEEKEEKEIEEEEEKILGKAERRRFALLAMILSLVVLDLAGDATEVLTVVFVAQVGDVLTVFVACVTALVAATAVETAIGNRLGRLLDAKKIGYLSSAVFLTIGVGIIVSSVLSL